MTEAEKAAEQINLALAALKTDLANAASKEDFNAINKTLSDFIEKNKDFDHETLKTELADISEQLGAIKEKFMGNNPSNKTLKEVVSSWTTKSQN